MTVLKKVDCHWEIIVKHGNGSFTEYRFPTNEDALQWAYLVDIDVEVVDDETY